MVVSAAFDELTEVLQCLESSDAEVKNVEIGERMIDEKDEITAELTVGLPVLAGVELRDEVSISAENFDLRDERVDVDLSVSIPVGDQGPHRGTSPSAVGGARNSSGSNAVPSYKDPDALAAVYERYDTFPEMTEALGADVTSETVRRYMVEYDIHDPSDSRPQAHRHAASTAETESLPRGADSETEADRADGSSTEGESARESPEIAARTSDGSDDSAATRDGTTEDTEDGDSAAETDGGSVDGETDDSAASDSGLAGKSVAELIAATDSGDSDDSLVADGLGIPKELTVAELAAIVNESNTLYEAKERLNVSQDHARRLLRQLNLIDLVTRRLGADQITVSPAEIRRRIDVDGSESVR